MNIDSKNFEKYDEITSLDEFIDMHEEPALNYINPVDEFKGHCSNIQTWFENGYNTQILHSNLSFPLLKALSRTDDPQVSKIFKEDILIFLELKRN